MNNTSVIEFEAQCVIDDSKVFYANNKVYRAIYNPEKAKLYAEIIRSDYFQQLIELGLIETKISCEFNIENCFLILEHKKINFFLHPAEMTDQMFWTAALMLIQLSKELAKHGLVLHDAHPWNITFDSEKAVFFDFGSIKKCSKLSNDWKDEFYCYYVIPIILSKWGFIRLAEQYRMQHYSGFGISICNSKIVKKALESTFFRVLNTDVGASAFTASLEKWLLSNQPKIVTGIWDDYDQSHQVALNDFKTLKQQFVFNVLQEFQPKKVVDLATNKGHFAAIAAKLGANVIAFDYESFCIDKGRAQLKGINVTFAKMNFTYPTPEYGWGLTGPNAFRRYYSDVCLALGIVHHICLIQKFPVILFCKSCMKFARTGVLLEFVYPEDKHVKSWNIDIPEEYNIDYIQCIFKEKFSYIRRSELQEDNGLKRQFFYFYNL